MRSIRRDRLYLASSTRACRSRCRSLPSGARASSSTTSYHRSGGNPAALRSASTASSNRCSARMNRAHTPTAARESFLGMMHTNMIVAIAPTIPYVVAIATIGGPMSVDDRLAPSGVFLLRIALGIMYLAHSLVLKLMTFGLAGTAQFFLGAGLPAAFAYLTFAAELVGGILLVLGIQARWVALALLPPLLGAIIWVHGANGWVFTAPGGGWEYPAYLIIASLAQALLGDGAYALMPSWGFASRSQKPTLQESAQGLPA